MLAQNWTPFKIPASFAKEPIVVMQAPEEPTPFCENLHMDELCEIIERDERTYTIFASIVDHTSAWKQ